MNCAVIFAGGKGIRMGSGIPKQFLEINGKPILVHTLEILQEHEEIDEIYLVVLEEYMKKTERLIKKFCLDKVVTIFLGGTTAQDSIYLGLLEVQKRHENPVVLIHDGVRPFVSECTISRNIEWVHKYGNAITCTACYETILVSQLGDVVEQVPYRKETFAA